MRRLLILMVLCLCAANLSAQNRVYCEIVERTISSKKVNVIIDFGQKRQKWRITAQTLVDNNGEKIVFNSKIDALNHMDSLGWNFLQAYTVVNGDDDSTSSTIHWLLYKDVVEGEDPYKGLVTKEAYEK